MTKSFADIKNLNPQKVGLGVGAPAIGIPFFWPSAAMPNSVITEWEDMTFLKFNGASFSASAYPKLALIFPGLIIPEARGVFPRIWDDGRGVDAGRSLLSDQLGTFVSVDINYADNGLVGAIGTIGGDGGIANVNGDTITTPLTKTAFQYTQSTIASSTSLVTNTVATRPRNIAFNFLVRAK
ncbi:TPA: phage tail protein [Yersinia enterocolitica]